MICTLRGFHICLTWILSACEFIHGMVDSEYLTEEEVEDSCREYRLPEAYEMEAERNAFECFVSFDGADDFPCGIFGLKYRYYP